MNTILKSILVYVSLVYAATVWATPTQYAEALRCLDRYRDAFGPTSAGTLCRGVLSYNATAVNQCVSLAGDRGLSLDAIAELCQGTSYDILSATMNCLDQALESMDQIDAARLCQRVSYAVYTSRFNCVAAAMDMVGVGAAAELCGGID